MKKLNELFENVSDIEVQGIQTDSRYVKSGDLFVCIKGHTVDGHDFVEQVIEKGAVAIVSEKELNHVNLPVVVVKDTTLELARLCDAFYESPTSILEVHGITGTNGKTTTACVLNHLLNTCGINSGYIGTNGITYNGLTKENKNTTPEALTLQRTLSDMIEAGVQEVAMEVSSHALSLHRTDYCQFKTAIFTNLTPEHLDFHANMEEYYNEKKKLFTQLKESGLAIINIDDVYGKRLYAECLGKVACLTFSIHEESDFKVSDIHYHEAGTSFTVTYRGKKTRVQSPLIGEFNIYNALGAMIAVCQTKGITARLVDALAKIPVIDGRMELINEGQNFMAVVDYAHTPDGVEQLLKCASKLGKDKVRVVIGCPGDRDKTKRPVIAKIATDYADDVIFTTDDPHSEAPEDILHEMLIGLSNTNYQIILDRVKAIEEAVQRTKENELLIIAGRGHQKLQYWSTGNIELDDRVVVRNFLKAI